MIIHYPGLFFNPFLKKNTLLNRYPYKAQRRLSPNLLRETGNINTRPVGEDGLDFGGFLCIGEVSFIKFKVVNFGLREQRIKSFPRFKGKKGYGIIK